MLPGGQACLFCPHELGWLATTHQKHPIALSSAADTGRKGMSKSDEEQEASKLAQLLQADRLPGVFVSSLRPWRDIADEALAHLVRSASARIFVRQGELVRIRRKEDGTPYIAALNDAALKHLL